MFERENFLKKLNTVKSSKAEHRDDHKDFLWNVSKG
jgi:hypothetical protein